MNNSNNHKPLSMYGTERVSRDIERFSSNNYVDEQLEIAKDLSTLGSAEGYTLSGAMYQELSCKKELDLMQKIECLSEAKKSWENSLAIKSICNAPMNRYTQQAHVGLACLPLWASLAVDGKNSTLETTQKSYNKLIDIGLKSIVAVENIDLESEDLVLQTNNDLRGGISEINALILLQRFIVQTLKDDSFTAVPSLLSQDYAKRRGSGGLNNGWDTSVFTKTSPEQQNVDLTYKLQIKTHHLKKEKIYSPDIIVIAMGSDLVDYNQPIGLSFDSIINNADKERQQTSHENLGNQIESSLFLDNKTEILLNLMG
ncbi:MAG: hypothetical protein WCK69_01385 [Candidatus Saccharibacteria bacterium]